MNDITEGKRAKANHRKSLEWHETIFEGSRDAIFIADSQNRLVAVNIAACDLTGYSKRELLLMRIPDLHEEQDLAAYNQLRDRIFAGESILSEARIKRKDGSKVDTEFSNSRMIVAGIPYMHTTARDITDRIRAEEALRKTTQLLETILDSTHLLIAYMDLQFNFVRVNRAYAEADERESSFFPGKNHFALYPNAENEAIFRHVVETGQPYFAAAKPFEYVEHPERGVSYWDWSLSPVKNPGGAVTGLVLTVVNVTERKRAEIETRKAIELYKTLFRVSPFATTLSRIDDHTIVQVNETFSSLTGFSTEEALGHRADELGIVFDLAQANRFQQQIREHGCVRDFEVVLKRKSGEVRTCLVFSDLVSINNERFFLTMVNDITERKRAEDALRETKEQLEAILHAIADGVTVLDSDGRLIYANDVVALAAGYSSAQEMLQNYDPMQSMEEYDLVDEAGFPFPVTQLPNRLVLQGKPAEPVVLGHRFKSTGAVRWSVVQARPIVDKEGKVQFVVTVIHDITERKQAEKALRENEKRFHSIVENLNQAYYEADRRGAFTYCNPGLLLISGYTERELLGTISFRIVAAEHRKDVIASYRQWMDEKRTDMSKEFIVQTKRGQKFWVEQVTRYEFDASGAFVKATNIVRDIHERKRVEMALRETVEKIQGILDSSPDAISLMDLNTTIIECNQTAVNMLGYSTKEELLGTSAFNFVVETDRQRALELLKEGLARGTMCGIELTMLRRDGSQFATETAGSVLRDPTGKPTGLVLITTDITERKRAEEEIKRKTDDLSLLNALNAAANRGESLQKIISILVEQTKRIFSSTGATVYLTSEDKQFLIMQNLAISEEHAHRIEQLIGMSIPEVRIAMTGESVYRQVWREGKPRLINGPEAIQSMIAEFTENRTLKKLAPAIFKILGIRAVITTPVIAGDTLIGMVDISRKAPFTETDLERMGIIAEDLSAILQRKQTEDALRAARTRLTNLSHRLLETQEQERRAIARELHDEIGQILTAAKIGLQIIRRKELPDDLALHFDENVAAIDKCLQRLRNLSLDLHPSVLDDLGLTAALRWQLERLQRRAGFQGHLTVEQIPTRFEPDVEIACFRVAQEALTNVARHAKAHNVEMNLRLYKEELLLRIQDDGIGFDSGKVLAEAVHGKSFGVLGMQERVALLGGRLEINSAVGKGTIVDIRLPFQVPRKQ